MPEAYLTTRRGFIRSLTLNRYDYSDWIIADKLKADKFKLWLKNKSGFLIYDIEDTCFFTISKLEEVTTSQYKEGVIRIITPPFKNAQVISVILPNFKPKG